MIEQLKHYAAKNGLRQLTAAQVKDFLPTIGRSASSAHPLITACVKEKFLRRKGSGRSKHYEVMGRA